MPGVNPSIETICDWHTCCWSFISSASTEALWQFFIRSSAINWNALGYWLTH